MRRAITVLMSTFVISVMSHASQSGTSTELRAEYDTSKVVTLTGRINGLESIGSDASLLLLNGSGPADSWAIEGDALAKLEQSGWYDRETHARSVKSNTEAVVTVYLPMSGSAAAARLLTLIDTNVSARVPQRVFGNFVRMGQFAYGLDVALPDGRRLPLSTRR